MILLINFVGGAAIALAIALFAWGMISLGRDNSTSKKNNRKTKGGDDSDWEDFMMEDWDLD